MPTTTGRAGESSAPPGAWCSPTGLQTRQGDPHSHRRRLVQPVFQRRAVGVFAEAIQEHVGRMLATWTGRTEIDLTEEMDRLAENVLIRAVMGELDDDTRQRFSEANHARRRFMTRAFHSQFPFPQLLPTRRNWEHRQADRCFRQVIGDRVRRARRGELNPNSLIAQMAAIENSKGEGLSDTDLFSEVWELITAGYETTREAMVWSTYLLATHPREAERLRAETVRLVGQQSVGPDDVARLEFAGMFFAETLRLFPPTWMFVRVAVADDVLPSGVEVKAGSKIYFCQYTAHRNEKYFPDAECFRPERFDAEARSARPRFAYFPFGGGPRVCVAEALAKLEGILVLASIARRFDLDLCPGQTVEPLGSITLRPKGPIRVAVRPV